MHHHTLESAPASRRAWFLLIEGVLLVVLLTWLFACLLLTTIPPGALVSGFIAMLSGAEVVLFLAYKRKRKNHREAPHDGDAG